MDFERIWSSWSGSADFSGVFSIRGEQGKIFEQCCGFRNQSERLPNNKDTAFGIASGTKLFTGLAVCKLIDEEKISLEEKICDVLPYELGQIDKRVTVFHLLTHTSGVGDYLDEESEDCDQQFEALNKKYPVYLYEKLDYYLQMITPLPPKYEPGQRFGYSNAGFILLGLVVEAVSGLPFQQYVHEKIILPCKLEHTGFYRADSLPFNTALGYMENGRTNIFSLPVIGGSDGGMYTCAGDLDTLWRAVFEGGIFSENMLTEFIKKQSVMNETESYGLGIYRHETENKLLYYAVGGDAGVEFFTAYLPDKKITLSAFGNTHNNVYALMETMIAAV
ncbi:MAG: beta-lactamase family protein [Oscillospiraceae bacterium]|nr:beta-lactamase family protein [Oscillospiraceae bacterium]